MKTSLFFLTLGSLMLLDYRGPAVGFLVLWYFWEPLCRVAGEVALDIQGWRLRCRLDESLHCDGSAREAYRLLVEGR